LRSHCHLINNCLSILCTVCNYTHTLVYIISILSYGWCNITIYYTVIITIFKGPHFPNILKLDIYKTPTVCPSQFLPFPSTGKIDNHYLFIYCFTDQSTYMHTEYSTIKQKNKKIHELKVSWQQVPAAIIIYLLIIIYYGVNLQQLQQFHPRRHGIPRHMFKWLVLSLFLDVNGTHLWTACGSTGIVTPWQSMNHWQRISDRMRLFCSSVYSNLLLNILSH